MAMASNIYVLGVGGYFWLLVVDFFYCVGRCVAVSAVFCLFDSLCVLGGSY